MHAALLPVALLPMIELLRELSHWLIGFADSDWAVAVLAVTAFTESIFFPIPPDPLLIGMSFVHPKAALLFACVTTVASVTGAVAGHWIGKRYGRPVLDRFVSADKVDRVESLFNRYGVWAILTAAITPIPYKVFAITAGVLDMPRTPFVVASLIGRGARMFLIGGLIFLFGEAIRGFLEDRFELVMIASGIALVAAVALFLLIMRLRKSSTKSELTYPPSESGV